MSYYITFLVAIPTYRVDIVLGDDHDDRHLIIDHSKGAMFNFSAQNAFRVEVG